MVIGVQKCDAIHLAVGAYTGLFLSQMKCFYGTRRVSEAAHCVAVTG